MSILMIVFFWQAVDSAAKTVDVATEIVLTPNVPAAVENGVVLEVGNSSNEENQS